jgi:hypothetical protein
MNSKNKLSLALCAMLMASTAASAQSGRVSLNPVPRAGQENRYVITASVDTHVSPIGVNGVASIVHRETTATVLVRAVTNEKGEPANEAVVEAISTRSTVDGVDRPGSGSSLVGQKFEYQLDSQGRATRVSQPEAATESGLSELILSLTRWAPAGDVAVGQSWGQSGQTLSGDYGYISAAAISEIPKGATISYKLSSVDGDRAIIEGAIALKQSGASSLMTREGRVNVTVIASGNGSTRVDYDVTAGRIVAAITESALEGRVVTMSPKPAGEKPQPHESSLVENARFSVKLIP